MELEEIAVNVRDALRRNITDVFSIGKWLTIGHQLTETGDAWETWLWNNFGRKVAWASKMESIAANPVLVELSHAKPEQLPTDAEVLYQLSRMPEDKLRSELDQVRAGMSRGEAHDMARKALGKPSKAGNPGESASQLRHKLDAAERRAAALEGVAADFDAAVESAVEARLGELSDSRVADAVAAVIDPDTTSNPELAVLAAVEAHHQDRDEQDEQDQEVNEALRAVPEAFRKDVLKYTRDGARPELTRAFEEYETAFRKLQLLLFDAKRGRGSEAA